MEISFTYDRKHGTIILMKASAGAAPIALLLISLIVIVSAVTGGSIWYKQGVQSEPRTPEVISPAPTNPQKQATSPVASTPKPQAVGATKEFHSSHYQFSLRYPHDWYVQEGKIFTFFTNLPPSDLEKKT